MFSTLISLSSKKDEDAQRSDQGSDWYLPQVRSTVLVLSVDNNQALRRRCNFIICVGDITNKQLGTMLIMSATFRRHVI